MQHSTIDQYAKESRFYNLDPRAKIIGIIIFVIIVALLKNIQTLIISLIFIISLIVISSVPFKHIIKRYIFAFPFIIFAAIAMYISNSFISSISIFIRISSCVLGLILLSSSTPFFDLLKGLQSLKVPNIFIILLMFTYRYFFVFIEEMHRMKIARKARGFHGGKHLFDKQGMKVISNTAGMILIRAYERGVRIYDSLLLRGYDGKIKTLKKLNLTKLDFGFCLLFICISCFLIIFDLEVIF